ncbi:RNA polymerase sigma factor [Kribbella sp. NPDC049227]|uniref:RNA polymerase sigma factor n=1 Tax=Kribbella sp. NPDC049227 TaxID=3364113 RepID=UPI0037206F38
MNLHSVTSAADRSDADLMAGSMVDFGLIYDRHARAIYRYGLRRVGPDVVDDVVADTFLIAYERREQFDPARMTALPWLYGIATNVVHRHRFAERRHHRAMARLPPAGHELAFSDQLAARVDAALLVGALSAELARMPARQRDVLFLFAAGLSYADIAATLGIPIGTVMSRLHRARARLRPVLAALPSSGVDDHEIH